MGGKGGMIFEHIFEEMISELFFSSIGVHGNQPNYATRENAMWLEQETFL